jgi:predicted AlkP superfamily pyrophosphatase or phosphodiesterase
MALRQSIVLCVLAGLLAAGPAEPQSGVPLPRLVVIIVVDQMRADYIDRFGSDWNAGLKRLLVDGARFSRAAFPYLTTVTCPGMATISTGAFPSHHGVFQNSWYDRASGRVVTCTEDPSAQNIAYVGRADGGDSASKLRLPTFADEMRAQRGARVVSLSLKARSAIMLAGQGGDAVTWLSEPPGDWATSTAFSRQRVPAVEAFIAANPVADDFGRAWARLLPPDRYQGPDAGEAEAPPRGWTSEFPHTLGGGESRTPDAVFRNQWERSPFADAYLARMATALTEAFALGASNGTDVLAVSFSTPDLVGHAFGPGSHEVQDVYAHLDRTLGAFFERLDALVGRGRYVVGFSSDHGVSPIPEQARRTGLSAGRLSSARIAEAAERPLQALLGPGSYVARVSGNDVYFETGILARLQATPSALQGVVDALTSLPGIARVFRSEELADGGASNDRLLAAAALSYVPGLSGDLIVVPAPGWMFAATGVTHATANPDDQRVPLIVMGPGVRPGIYDDEVTPADLAPTLAALTRIALPRASGRVLQAALAPAGPP